MASKCPIVAEAAARGAYAEALSVALAAWRAAPDAAVAEVVDAMGKRALAAVQTPKARDKDEFQAAWLALANVTGLPAVGWLASNLATRVPEVADYRGMLRPDYVQTRFAAWFARLAAISSLSPDPRIAAGAVDVLRQAPFSAWDDAVYGPLVKLLSANPDRRQLSRLEDLLASPRSGRAATRYFLERALPPILEQLRELPQTMPAAERAEWQVLAVPAAGPRAEGALESELLAVIYDDPEDFSARAVYADWLTDSGDPRGEFIRLQLDDARRGATDAERKQMKTLLKAHKDDWLGPLGLVLNKIEFRAGFIDSGELAHNAAAAPTMWTRAAESPALATLRRLSVGRGSAAHYGRFLLSPQAKGLEQVEVPTRELLERLLEGPPRSFQSLAIKSVAQPKAPMMKDWGRVFPQLHTLDVEVTTKSNTAAVEKLRGHPMLEGLRVLRLFALAWSDPVIALRDAVNALLLPSKLERLEVLRFGARASFWRQGNTLAAQLVDPTGFNWHNLIGQLPQLGSLELVLPIDLPPNQPSTPEARLEVLKALGIVVSLRREVKLRLDTQLWMSR